MRALIISAAVLGLAIATTPATASGTGGGATRGGGGLGGFGGGASASRFTEAERLVRRGRSQVRKRITCKKCEYHDRLNKDTASEVAQAVRGGKFDLNDRNREAVLLYLRDRYGV